MKLTPERIQLIATFLPLIVLVSWILIPFITPDFKNICLGITIIAWGITGYLCYKDFTQ